ncbi:MAG: endolytic transglycosylase MltG [Clostridia bacterium]|nr:endolytic transglycosylase MltG [Clostridia bacterium]
MDENKNKRPRPRRTVEDIGASAVEKSQLNNESEHTDNLDVPVLPKAQRPRPVQKVADTPTVPKPAPKVETPKEEPKPEPKVEPKVEAPKAVPLPQKEIKQPLKQPTENEAENEKTRLTDVQPKAELKTPVRQAKKVKKESSGALSGILKAILYITFVLVVSAFLAYFIIQFANDVFAFVKSDEAVEVVIPKNATVEEVADILGERKVIKYPTLFKLYAKVMNEDGVDEEGKSVFIAGTYQVSPMNNYMQLLPFFMERAKPREVVSVTFPEGTTTKEMVRMLVEDYGIASYDDFDRAINEYDYGFEFLDGINELKGRRYRLEGYLFPDTYQFYTDSSAETVIYKMLDNFNNKLKYISSSKPYSERLEELGLTLDQVIILASMIEREVKFPTDYYKVSSVFHNRLKRPADFPRFDSDVTAVYAIDMEMGKVPAEVEAKEIDFDSPYNTRKYAGFPPGAIANPGYVALRAAFYAKDTNYYYFVAQKNGYNLYATTYDEHKKNEAAAEAE